MIIEALLATAPTPVPLTVGGHTFRMVPVRGGTFMMGDFEDLWVRFKQVVELSNFYIGQFPVTQEFWKTVMNGENSSYFKGERRPMEQVLWDDTQVFIEKLNLLKPDWNFRLPTEAEWEYAARGGHVNLLSGQDQGGVYSGSDLLEAVSWWNENSHDETKPVGLKAPNALGIFDMSGNVSEWCADWFDHIFYENRTEKDVALNPRNDKKGLNRVIRGGSWGWFEPQYLRVVARDYYAPKLCLSTIGFRLAASPSSSVISA